MADQVFEAKHMKAVLIAESPGAQPLFGFYIFVQLCFLCTLLFAPLAILLEFLAGQILLEFLVTRVSNGCGEV